MLLSLDSSFLLRFSRAGLFISALGVGALASGCADPDGKFQAFTDRENTVEANTPPPDLGGPCPSNKETKVGESDGDFYFSLSAKINPNKPVVFLAKLTTAAKGAGVEFSMSLQPLLASDKKTPTGAAADVGPFTIESDGSFNAMLPTLTVPGNANPIIAADLVAQVNLSGHVCGGTLADFVCGAVTGSVSKPIPIPDLKGSTFTMQRITDPMKYPTPVLDCAKTAPK